MHQVQFVYFNPSNSPIEGSVFSRYRWRTRLRNRASCPKLHRLCAAEPGCLAFNATSTWEQPPPLQCKHILRSFVQRTRQSAKVWNALIDDHWLQFSGAYPFFFTSLWALRNCWTIPPTPNLFHLAPTSPYPAITSLLSASSFSY